MKGEIFNVIRRQLAAALTGILVGNTVLFAQAAAITETFVEEETSAEDLCKSEY